MQIEELDDQWCRHLHRSGVPQNDRSDDDRSLSTLIIFFDNVVLASNKTFTSELVFDLHKFYSDLINRLEQKAKGPGAPLADCKHRKTLLRILQ
uniref:Uncharacterized protein n=1 Tax=Romanomermis culicivorax TaxID=13658 RepID=A0A915I0I4_ROMCU